MKKSFLALASLFLLMVVFCGADYPRPTTEFFVSDYADVLSAETKSFIMDNSPSLAQQTEAQISVLTVKTLGGEDPASYALNVGREWGIGGSENDNGVLILLCPDEGKIRVEVGRGLEGALNDAKVGRLIDTYALSSYKSGDFDTGTLELYKAVLSQVMTEYGLDALPGYEEDAEQESDDVAAVVTILFVLLMVFLFFRPKMKGGGSGGSSGSDDFRGGGSFFGGGPYIGTGGGFHGGGGFGGGFGGGGGFSGGGGGFSGGGGGFGGGGAGRSF